MMTLKDLTRPDGSSVPGISLEQTETFLKDYSQVGDPVADPVIEAMNGRCDGDWLDTVYVLAAQGNEACKQFVQHAEHVPEWVDFSSFDIGRRFALAVAPLGGLSLLLGSLMEGYAIPQGANLLASTGRLTEGAYRRVHETGQMVSSVYRKDGLKPGNEAHRTLLKVRLIHAVVRYHTKDHPERVGLPVDETPINQIGMAFTLTQFCWFVLENIKRLGMHPTRTEEKSLADTWRYAAYLLGVDHRLTPETYAQQAWLHDCIMQSQTAVNDNSRLLSRSLLKAVSRQAGFPVPEGLLMAFSRFFIGDDLADQLGFRKSTGWNLMVRSFTLLYAPLNILRRFIPSLLNPVSRFGRWYTDYMILRGLDGKETDFNLK